MVFSPLGAKLWRKLFEDRHYQPRKTFVDARANLMVHRLFRRPP